MVHEGLLKGKGGILTWGRSLGKFFTSKGYPKRDRAKALVCQMS
jgi:hypothetical protein